MTDSVEYSKTAATLADGICTRSATVGVIGLGYVGLPLAVEFAKKGFRTAGIDMSSERVGRVNAAENYIGDVQDGDLRQVVEKGRLRAVTHLREAKSPDILFICVPTPVTAEKDPDVSYIESASDAIAAEIRQGQLIILKSTTFPNTTEGIVLPRLQRGAGSRGLEVGKDYFVAFSPERVDPGNKQFRTANTPVVVGGVTATCTELAAITMEQIVDEVHRVTSPKVAEMEKLLENIFRSVNIALVNELARLCDRLGGISIWDVVEAAATKPFGYMPFFPGPGVGGHCIPIDPYYLSWLARRYDFETSFITLAARVNEEMPYYVRDSVLRHLARLPVAASEAKVLILGVAFKKNVDDIRYSSAVKLMELLFEEGIRNLSYSDPHVPKITVSRGGTSHNLTSLELTKESLQEQDIIVIATDHDAFPYEEVAKHASMIIDTRNTMARVTCDPSKLVLLGGGEF